MREYARVGAGWRAAILRLGRLVERPGPISANLRTIAGGCPDRFLAVDGPILVRSWRGPERKPAGPGSARARGRSASGRLLSGQECGPAGPGWPRPR